MFILTRDGKSLSDSEGTKLYELCQAYHRLAKRRPFAMRDPERAEAIMRLDMFCTELGLDTIETYSKFMLG